MHYRMMGLACMLLVGCGTQADPDDVVRERIAALAEDFLRGADARLKELCG
jgi:hypothetical protein